MAVWIYFAGDSDNYGSATLSATMAMATEHNVICRSSRAKNGSLIPRVSKLTPGDTILLAYRSPPTHYVYLRATVGKPLHPAKGTSAIDVIRGAFVEELQRIGYTAGVDPDTKERIIEVIRLDDVAESFFELKGSYEGHNSIRVPDDRDLAAAGFDPPTPSTPLPPKNAGERGAEKANKTARATRTAPAINRGIPRSAARDRVFDAYMMIDWSAKRGRASKDAKDSLWLGMGEWEADEFRSPKAEHFSTRDVLYERLATRLNEFIRHQKRVLVGFDFAFGYPKGFAPAILGSSATWENVHAFMLENLKDDESRHNGVDLAKECNRRIAPGSPGPFWGCHPSDAVPETITGHRVGVFAYPYEGLDEWRLTDRRACKLTRTLPVWKLNQGVSVGMQTIVGLHYLAKLRRALVGQAKIWPFETGFKVPDGAAIVLAEIFPSIVATDESVAGEEPKDKRQVVSCVLEAALRDATGRMAATLGEPGGLSAEERNAVLREEGWMLFLPPVVT